MELVFNEERVAALIESIYGPKQIEEDTPEEKAENKKREAARVRQMQIDARNRLRAKELYYEQEREGQRLKLISDAIQGCYKIEIDADEAFNVLKLLQARLNSILNSMLQETSERNTYGRLMLQDHESIKRRKIDHGRYLEYLQIISSKW